MKKEIYSCDKCGKKVDSAKELHELKLEFGSYCRTEFSKRMDLCSSCCEKLGLVKRVVKDDKVVDEIQTVQDKLYDICVEIIKEVIYEYEDEK